MYIIHPFILVYELKCSYYYKLVRKHLLLDQVCFTDEFHFAKMKGYSCTCSYDVRMFKIKIQFSQGICIEVE